MSITIQTNPKGRRNLALGSLVGKATPILKGTDSEGYEFDALQGGFDAIPKKAGGTGGWFTGMGTPEGTLGIRRINGDLYRLQVLFPAGRGGIATGKTETVRRFLFHSDTDVVAWVKRLVADPMNPEPLEVVPHGERR
jgi:hypothetical protein